MSKNEKKEPFTNEIIDIPKLEKENPNKNDNKCLIALVAIFVISVILSVIITLNSSSEDKESDNKFIAKYKVNNKNEKIILFNSNYLSSISSI